MKKWAKNIAASVMGISSLMFSRSIGDSSDTPEVKSGDKDAFSVPQNPPRDSEIKDALPAREPERTPTDQTLSESMLDQLIKFNVDEFSIDLERRAPTQERDLLNPDRIRDAINKTIDSDPSGDILKTNPLNVTLPLGADSAPKTESDDLKNAANLLPTIPPAAPIDGIDTCTFKGLNDDKLKVEDGELSTESMTLSNLNKADGSQYVDGGWTSSLDVSCSTALSSKQQLGVSITHDTYTSHADVTTGVASESERPMGGIFSLSFGGKDQRTFQISPRSKLSIHQYVQGSVGYVEQNWTQKIQNTFHSALGFDQRDYSVNPMKKGLTGDASYGVATSWSARSGDLSASLTALGGTTYGDYRGVVVGGRLEFGVARKNVFDPGLPFKSEASPMPFPSPIARKGDWRIGLEVGQHMIDQDHRYGDAPFKQNLSYSTFFTSKQISSATSLFSGISISENSAPTGPNYTGQFIMGLDLHFSSKKPEGKGR